MGNILNLRSMLIGNSSTIRRSTKKEEKNRASQKSDTLTFKRSFNASRTLSQLANATTKSQVAAIERTVRAQMQSMKKQSGSEEAILQMKKILQKTNRKHQALTKEEQLENTKKIAKIAQNEKEEVKLEDELTRKRRSRMSREQADVINGIDIFDKKSDASSNGSQGVEQSSTIDITCNSFDISVGVVDTEIGVAIDTLL